MYWSDMNMSKFMQHQEKINTVILPVGTTEAHGPHCPLGTDFMIPEKIASLINGLLGNKVFIAPAVNYGSSWSLGIYPGTINISSETLACYVEEIGNGFLQWDINNIVILNGHGGNRSALQIAAQHLANSGGNVLIINYWLDYMEQILTICESRGHAGEDETSLMLAIAPELVDMNLATVNNEKSIGQIYTADISLQTFTNALTGDATKASAEKGKKILEAVTNEICDLLEKFMKGQYLK